MKQKASFSVPSCGSLPRAQGRFLAFGGEKNKGAWHMPFECRERGRGLRKMGEESRVLEMLFCVPGAVGLVAGKITNLICSFPCTACISLTRPGKLKGLLCGTAVKALMIYI